MRYDDYTDCFAFLPIKCQCSDKNLEYVIKTAKNLCKDEEYEFTEKVRSAVLNKINNFDMDLEDYLKLRKAITTLPKTLVDNNYDMILKIVEADEETIIKNVSNAEEHMYLSKLSPSKNRESDLIVVLNELRSQYEFFISQYLRSLSDNNFDEVLLKEVYDDIVRNEDSIYLLDLKEKYMEKFEFISKSDSIYKVYYEQNLEKIKSIFANRLSRYVNKVKIDREKENLLYHKKRIKLK